MASLKPVDHQPEFDHSLVPVDYDPFAAEKFANPVAAAVVGSLAKSAVNGFLAPGRAMQATEPVTSDQMIAPALDMAGLVTGGAGVVPAEANSLRMGIKAYHGSPHDFEKFSLDKIGTGEGAQAYGHGLYFAENEGVAKSYRDTLSAPVRKRIDPNSMDPQDIAIAFYRSLGKGGISHAERMAESHPEQADAYRKAAEIMRSGDPYAGASKGKMYEVNINADPAHFLDYDKVLAADHPARSKLRGLAQMGLDSHEYGVDRQLAKDAFLAADNPNLTGDGFYRQMTNAVESARPKLKEQGNPKALFGGTAPLANEELMKAGIPGIKYLDQSSRAAGEGSRNYVVFNDKLIDIVRKYAVAGMALPPAIAAEYAQRLKPVDHDPFEGEQ